MQKITPFLWFNDNAEEAVNFYTGLFSNSKIGTAVRYSEAGAKASGMKPEMVMTVPFQLEDYEFVAINGGPVFTFTPAISFFVNSTSNDEIQKLWDNLSDGGKVLMPLDKYPFSEKYGWVQDKFGVSWQLIKPMGEAPQKIIPSLMFVGGVLGKAEAAINQYTSIFPDSKVKNIFKYGPEHGKTMEGKVMYADFELAGEVFAAMDGFGEHNFNFNEAISFVVGCDTQAEIDHYWNKLSEGGDPKAQMCGWLKDRFGVSWQIVPSNMGELMQTPGKSAKVMEAVLKMKKIELAAVNEAAEVF